MSKCAVALGVLAVGFQSLLTAEAAVEASGCDRLTTGPEREFSDELGLPVTLQGVFLGRFDPYYLCAEGRQGHLPPPEMVALNADRRGAACAFLDMGQLLRPGAHEVLGQWNGDRVEVVGRLGRPSEPLDIGVDVSRLRRPDDPEARIPTPLADDRKRLVGPVVVESIRVLGRPSSPAFCLGHEGPLEPAPLEDAYDGFDYSRLLATEFQDRSRIRPHVYKAQAAYFPPGSAEYSQVVEFSVPEPYAGRDIVSFAAFGREHFVYELRDGTLYSWQGGKTVLLEKPAREATVLGRMIDGNMYYLARTGTPTSSRPMLKLLTPMLDIHDVFEIPEGSSLTEFENGWDLTDPESGALVLVLLGEDGMERSYVVKDGVAVEAD